MDMFTRLSSGWGRFAFRHPILVMLFLLILTAALGPFAGRLRIDTDLKKLLPRSYARVQAMDDATAKIGDVGYLSVLVEHDDTEEAIHFIDSIAEILKNAEYTRTIYYKNPLQFLRDKRYLLVPADKYERVNRFIKKKRLEANPFYFDLEEDEEGGDRQQAEDDLSSIKEKYLKLENAKEYHVSEDGRFVALQLRPRQAVTNLSSVRQLYAAVEKEVAALKSQGFSKNMQVYVTGSLRNKLNEYDVVIADIINSAWVSGVLIILVLLFYFRNIITIFLLLLPLVCGLVWTFAITYFTIGHLNTITGMLFVVLFGLGIDHGIHLIRRYIQERTQGSMPKEASITMLDRTGRATAASVLTTAGGFFLMLLSDFKGFSHLGFIAGIAMLLVLAAYFTILPCILAILDCKSNGRLLTPKFATKLGQRFWQRYSCALIGKQARFASGTMFLLCIVGGIVGSQIGFDYDFDKLRAHVPASEEAMKKQGNVYTESLTPGAVLFAPNYQVLDQLLYELSERKRMDKESPTIGRIVSIRDAWPAIRDQEERRKWINKIVAQLTPTVLKQINDPDIEKMFLDLKSHKDEPIIHLNDVPLQIRQYFTPQDGSEDQIIFVYASVERRQGKNAIAFADDMAPIRIGTQIYVPTGGGLIFADMLSVAVSQGLGIFCLSLVAMAALLMVQFWGVRHMTRVLLGLLSGLAVMAIVLKLFNVQISFYNMAILAGVVGMGIDSAIHLYVDWLSERKQCPNQPKEVAMKVLQRLAAPISASTLTTIAGYSGLLLSHHPGLASMGILAVVGLGSCYVIALTLFPLYLRDLGPREALVNLHKPHEEKLARDWTSA